METKLTRTYLRSISDPTHLPIWLEHLEGNIRTGGTITTTSGCLSMYSKLEGTKRHKDVYIVYRRDLAEDIFMDELGDYADQAIEGDIAQFDMTSERKSWFTVYIITYTTK